MAWSHFDLVRSPWLSRQPAPVAGALLDAGRVQRLEAGQSIYGQDDPDGGVFAVISGRLSVEAMAGPKRTVLIDILRTGAWFGQSAQTEVTVRARSAATLFLIPDAVLKRVGHDRPDVWQAVSNLVYGQLQSAVRMVARLLTASPAELIALRLLALAEGQPPFVAVSQSELGELTGMTRKAANAHLALLEEQGLVKRAYGKVLLVDEARLRGLAGAE
jgi:CRP/FNR family transcriptional regulator, cyclic AMP receptor protein